jgi:hypothetical protein
MNIKPLEEEQETCPRCGKTFRCSKSGRCWCFELALPPDMLDEIEKSYDRCLCPECLKEYASGNIRSSEIE